MLVSVHSAAFQGIEAYPVRTEVDIRQGAKYYLVGLPDNAIRESWQRMETAIRSVGYHMPRQRIVINLSPADRPKQGAYFDLPMTLGILAASGQIDSKHLENRLFIGELGLDGSLLPVRGALPAAVLAAKMGLKEIWLPKKNIREAQLQGKLKVYGFENLGDLLQMLDDPPEPAPFCSASTENTESADFADVKGQAIAKRAMEIAAAGGHNSIMIGPPGAGKTMLAKRLPGILPPPSHREQLESTCIHSVHGSTLENGQMMEQRPFRAPHHSCSDAALVGGGSPPMPGEISLAHNGVLFMDELPEFRRQVLELLRQPLEERRIAIARARFKVDFPANFMLLASMNPCPCGFKGHPTKKCVCSKLQAQKYLNRISGPLLDRIDLHVLVSAVPIEELNRSGKSESSSEIRQRVLEARKIQKQRFKGNEFVHLNAQMGPVELRTLSMLTSTAQNLLNKAVSKLQLSARAWDRIQKVARSIADLDHKYQVEEKHIAEAVGFRALDRVM
jgi:magnesium chelatase family protein